MLQIMLPKTVRILAMGALVALLGAAAVAEPQRSRSGGLQVRARIAPKCSVSTTELDFSANEPMLENPSRPREAVGTVSFSCTKGTRAQLALDEGEHELGGSRRMASASGEFIEYALYQDRPHTLAWTGETRVSVFVTATPDEEDSTLIPALAAAMRRSPGGRGSLILAAPSTLLANMLTVFGFQPTAVGYPVISSEVLRTDGLRIPGDSTTTSGSVTRGPVLLPAEVGVIVYGDVPGGQQAPPGRYSDVVRVNVVF